MKYVLSAFLAVLIILALSACGGEKKSAEQKAEQPAAEAQAKVTLDALADSMCVGGCGMVFKSATEIADTVHYAGKVYGVCGPKCKEAFKSDPEGHLAHLHEPKEKPAEATH